MSRRVSWLFIVTLLTATPAVSADPSDADAIAYLIRGGALELALKRLDEEQAQASGADWLAFERRRLELYAARRQWDALSRRVDDAQGCANPGARGDHRDVGGTTSGTKEVGGVGNQPPRATAAPDVPVSRGTCASCTSPGAVAETSGCTARRVPADLPEDFRRWALRQAAEARLAANDSPGARRYLRQLLWQQALPETDAAAARRLVIRSYLQEDNLGDARAGLQRYTQDYPARGDDWQVLHAEILLRAEDYKGAFAALTGAQSAEARLLRQLAGLHARLYKPQEVLQESARLAAGFKNHRANRRRALALQDQAAMLAGDEARRVRALEQALALPETGAERFFRADADALWKVYENVAESIGNDARLLVGDDNAWLAKAKALAAKEPHKARAVHAFLAHHAADEGARLAANRLLAESLLVEGHAETLRALYLRSSRIAGPEAVPAPVRYRLAEIALAQFDMKLAAALLKDLEPPEGEDADLWALRRARTLVYVGDVVPAQTLLLELLDRHNPVDTEFARHFLQVVFDLQTLNLHSEALTLLEKLYDASESKALRRELLYWRADSHAALGQHALAGELYLRSAVFNGGNGDDPWGQTARFYAAGAMARAGLTDDARHIYTVLLKATPDPARRAHIERQLQQLWLHATPTTP